MCSLAVTLGCTLPNGVTEGLGGLTLRHMRFDNKLQNQHNVEHVLSVQLFIYKWGMALRLLFECKSNSTTKNEVIIY